MNILLVRYSGKSDIHLSECVECLALGYLAAVLRANGFDVRILDGSLMNLDIEETVNEIVKEYYDVIGFTIDDPTKINNTFKVIRKLRAEGVNAHITMGGHTPTFAFKNILQECNGLDSIVRFEGENTLLELVKAIDIKKEWREIEGLTFRANGRICATTIRPLIKELDSLPFPERDTLANLQNSKRASVSSSRGCYGKCVYCSVCSFYGLPEGEKWRARSPDNVVKEIETLVDKWGVSEIEFIDDNFVGTTRTGKARAINIAEKMKALDKGIMIALYCRPNEVEQRTFEKLKEAGLKEVLVGIESGNDSVLRRMRKGTTVYKNLKALEILRNLDIDTTIGFIMFDPYTTLEELQENLSFLRSTGLNFLRVSLNIMQPYPGTAINYHLRKGHNLSGTYKEFRYNFLDQRVKVVYDVIAGTMDGILSLALKISDVERGLRRLVFDPANFGLSFREEKAVRKTVSTIISRFADIYEEIIKFASDPREEKEVNLFRDEIRQEVEKFRKESIAQLNVAKLLLENTKKMEEVCL